VCSVTAAAGGINAPTVVALLKPPGVDVGRCIYVRRNRATTADLLAEICAVITGAWDGTGAYLNCSSPVVVGLSRVV
jgi:hypothetical protein